MDEESHIVRIDGNREEDIVFVCECEWNRMKSEIGGGGGSSSENGEPLQT